MTAVVPKHLQVSQGAGRDDAPKRLHIPVLLSEVVECLAPGDGQLIIDATFGAGGYSRAILEAADCRVLAFDRDRRLQFRGMHVVQTFRLNSWWSVDRLGHVSSAHFPSQERSALCLTATCRVVLDCASSKSANGRLLVQLDQLARN